MAESISDGIEQHITTAAIVINRNYDVNKLGAEVVVYSSVAVDPFRSYCGCRPCCQDKWCCDPTNKEVTALKGYRQVLWRMKGMKGIRDEVKESLLYFLYHYLQSLYSITRKCKMARSMAGGTYQAIKYKTPAYSSSLAS